MTKICLIGIFTFHFVDLLRENSNIFVSLVFSCEKMRLFWEIFKHNLCTGFLARKFLPYQKKICDELSFQRLPIFQAIAEDAMVGWLMSNRVNASFVHLKVGGMPALLPIPLHSLQMGLSNPWFRQLSRWDTSWKNLVNQKNTSFVISQHYIKPEEMFILYYHQK